DHPHIAEFEAVIVVEGKQSEIYRDLADPVQSRVVERSELAAQVREPRDAPVQDVERTAEQHQESGQPDLMLMEGERGRHRDQEPERRQQVRVYLMPDQRIRQWTDRPVDAPAQ